MQLPQSVLLALLQACLVIASPTKGKRACPNIHVFGARETTVSPGYGSASTVVNNILSAYSGSTAEAIVYPACGGQSSCGGETYSQSVAAGITAAATAINNYNRQCPSTILVLVGYSQGSEIFDVGLCGGGDPNQGVTNTAVLYSAAAVSKIAAAIFMGDPLYHTGLPYNVGSCANGGFDARPAGFTCANPSKIKSYCDSTDPYCCNGSNAATHNGYGAEYGSVATTFVKSQIAAMGSGTTTPTSTTAATSTPTGGTGGTCGAMYAQCAGIGFTGATCCVSGSTCKYSNDYFSQCL